MLHFLNFRNCFVIILTITILLYIVVFISVLIWEILVQVKLNKVL